jgi:hypothetical protein
MLMLIMVALMKKTKINSKRNVWKYNKLRVSTNTSLVWESQCLMRILSEKDSSKLLKTAERKVIMEMMLESMKSLSSKSKLQTF